MKLKLISLTALSALALGGVALAQDNEAQGGRGGMRHDPMERTIESLNLTPDQKTKVQPILDEAKPKMEQIHKEAMEKSKAVMEDAMAKIRPLLTPEQQTKLDEAKNSRHGNHEGGRRNRQGGGGASEDNG